MLVGMYDGSVMRISGDMDEAILKAMLTPSGGEVVQR